MKTNLFLKLTLLTLIVGSSACGGGGGGNPFVRDLRLLTYAEQEEAWVEIEADVDTGDASLPAIEYPVVNPRSGAEYGRIGVKPILGGGSEIELALNLSQVLNEPLADRQLPNGLDIPVGGLDPESLLAYNIQDGPSKAYIAFTGNDGIVGTAIVIPEMDALGKEIGRSNFFPQFNHPDNDIYGVAGIFTSPVTHQSGFGVFADLGSIAKEIRENLTGSAHAPEVGPYFRLSSTQSYPSFDPVSLSWRKQVKIGRHLQRLHQKRKRLSIR